MVPTVALLNVEAERTTHCVACRGLVARARQVALAIARSKLKRDARRFGPTTVVQTRHQPYNSSYLQSHGQCHLACGLNCDLSSAPGLLEYVHSS